MVSKNEPDRSDWWPCACMKRNKRTDTLTHIKLHSPNVKRCRVCGCTKAAVDEMRKAEDHRNAGGAK